VARRPSVFVRLLWMEEAGGCSYFALNDTDHRSHTEQNTAIAGSTRTARASTLPGL
jgi:hypothetical protein